MKTIHRIEYLCTAALIVGALLLGCPDPASAQKQPDLKITKAELVDATAGVVAVEITNIGAALAGKSMLRLIVWELGKFEKKYVTNVFAKVSVIPPHQKVNIQIKANVPINSNRYSLFVDISNQVKEKNEQNNRFEGEAGKS